MAAGVSIRHVDTGEGEGSVPLALGTAEVEAGDLLHLAQGLDLADGGHQEVHREDGDEAKQLTCHGDCDTVSLLVLTYSHLL